MDIQITDSMLKKFDTIFTLILEIDADFAKIAPDNNSLGLAKSNVIQIITRLNTMREDIKMFGRGEALPDGQKAAMEMYKRLEKKAKDAGLGGPPDFGGLGGGSNPFGNLGF